MYAIGWALISMGCAALNDFVFKLYGRKPRPIGLYFALIGLVWFLAFAGRLPPWAACCQDTPALAWGIVAGIFSALSNLLLILAMQHQEAGICATIYRLNLVPAAFLACLILGESLTAWKIMGIAAASGAVLLFFTPSRSTLTTAPRQSLVLITLASLLRAGMGLAYKQGLLLGGNGFLILTLNGLIWLAAGGIYHILNQESTVRPSLKTYGYGLLSGLLVCGIVYFMMLALRRGEASIILPITQLSFVVTSLIGIIGLNERLAWSKTAGLALAVLCVIFMAQAP